MRFTILKRQTTYLDYYDRQEEQACRIHYDKKWEFELEGRDTSRLEILTEHPLLWQLREPWIQLYIYESASDPRRVLFELDTCVRLHFHGWRTFVYFANEHYNLEQLLTKGSGLLYTGPFSPARDLTAVLDKHKIRWSTLPNLETITVLDEIAKRGKLLLMDSDYVIAKDFLVQLIDAPEPPTAR